jgi:hypothetical protein
MIHLGEQISFIIEKYLSISSFKDLKNIFMQKFPNDKVQNYI